jgi:Tol biopolymer transport system component
MGVGGFARLDQPWNLYRWSLPGGVPQPLLRDVGDPLGLAIAPDGRWLALGATRHGRRFGLWLVNTADGSADRLAFGKLGDPSFSPDGRHLAVLLFNDADHGELYAFDLP